VRETVCVVWVLITILLFGVFHCSKSVCAGSGLCVSVHVNPQTNKQTHKPENNALLSNNPCRVL